jgi:hypothetical protein
VQRQLEEMQDRHRTRRVATGLLGGRVRKPGSRSWKDTTLITLAFGLIAWGLLPARTAPAGRPPSRFGAACTQCTFRKAEFDHDVAGVPCPQCGGALVPCIVCTTCRSSVAVHDEFSQKKKCPRCGGSRFARWRADMRTKNPEQRGTDS